MLYQGILVLTTRHRDRGGARNCKKNTNYKLKKNLITKIFIYKNFKQYNIYIIF